MKDFKTLHVWQRGHGVTLKVYKLSRLFPKEEIYGLTSQIRRASVSIAANIAEGAGRSGDIEMARFFQIAFGSACELEYHLLLAKDLEYLPAVKHSEVDKEVVEVKKMLASFLRKLRSDR